MKDFKQTAKMKAEGSHYCGGGKVKKYADGGVAEAIMSGKARPVPMPKLERDPNEVIDTPMGPIKRGDLKGVPMPQRDFGGTDIPGYGKVKPVPMKSRGDLGLMKKGGKVKRGKVC